MVRCVCVGRETGVIYEVYHGGEARPWGRLSDALISLFAPERVIPS